MRLDIGSGDLPLGEGWTTVDLYAPADVKADMAKLPFDTDSVDAIHCSHALEHIRTERVAEVLGEFLRVLRSRGTLTVEVPDLAWACTTFLKGYGTDRTDAYQAIYGEPEPGRQHLGGFTFTTLRDAVASAGFQVSRVQVVRSHGVTCIRAEAFAP